MAKTIEQLLKEIDFSPKEQAVYLAVLELGEAPVSPIAKKAHTNRGTTYDILYSLIDKGLVTKSEKKKKEHYSAIGIEGLENYLQNQRENWEAKIDSFKQLKPEFIALLGSAGAKPTVRFFEGRMGIKEVFLDQIRGKHKEIMSYSVASKLEEIFGDYLKTFTKQKSRTEIFTRVIVPEEPELKEYGEKYYGAKAKKLFSIKTVPKEKFPLEVEINIYGNKVSMISLNKNELVAVIIESPALAKNQRVIFELLWDRL